MNCMDKKLTRAERLVLWRRRNDWTQDQAAGRLGCCRTRYSQMENGVIAPVDMCGFGRRMAFRPKLQPAPTLPERLFLARRRSGLTLEQVADGLYVSRPTVLKMERRGALRLVKFWKNILL